ncbi:MAG TPA: hypothetical protein VMV90_03925 [Rectinemataceae bacterium]|nr:hypothetical protein [Rectinemataceae bacterium]
MPALLRLDLRSPLRFSLHDEASPLPLDRWWPFPSLGEGEEELYIFDESGTIDEETGNGPAIASAAPKARLAAALRPASAAPGGATHAAAAPGGGGAAAARSLVLSAGAYAFAQFAAGDLGALVAAMDDFVKECWWQRVPVSGPLYLRRVGEDGAAKLQLLRRSE